MPLWDAMLRGVLCRAGYDTEWNHAARDYYYGTMPAAGYSEEEYIPTMLAAGYHAGQGCALASPGADVGVAAAAYEFREATHRQHLPRRAPSSSEKSLSTFRTNLFYL